MSRLLFVQNSTEGPGALMSHAYQYGVEYDIARVSNVSAFPETTNYGAVVVLGGPMSANDDTERMKISLERVAETIETETPYLGICLGHQMAVKAMGGEVTKSPISEDGFTDPNGEPFEVALTGAGRADSLFDDLPDTLNVFESHGEMGVPTEQMTVLGIGKHCKTQAVRIGETAYGLQPHIELTEAMLDRWATWPSLRGVGIKKLITAYNSPQTDYAKVGATIFKNFLEIAELL